MQHKIKREYLYKLAFHIANLMTPPRWKKTPKKAKKFVLGTQFALMDPNGILGWFFLFFDWCFFHRGVKLDFKVLCIRVCKGAIGWLLLLKGAIQTVVVSVCLGSLCSCVSACVLRNCVTCLQKKERLKGHSFLLWRRPSHTLLLCKYFTQLHKTQAETQLQTEGIDYSTILSYARFESLCIRWEAMRQWTGSWKIVYQGCCNKVECVTG